jgi:hypothetical protein
MVEENRTLEAWIERISKEISTDKTLEDFIVSNGIYTTNGIENTRPYNSEGQLEKTNWKILSIAKSNKDVLTSLNYGVDAILVDTFKVNTEFLDKVRLDYITSIFIEREEKQYSTDNGSQYSVPIDVISSPRQFSIQAQDSNSIKNCFIELRDFLFENKNIGDIVLTYHFDKDFYKTINSLRAIRLLFCNLTTAFIIKPNLSIITVPGYEINEDQHELIYYTMGGLASIIGGSNFISLRKWDGNETQSRLAQNILHLLRYESKMDEFHDPVAGSYFFENATHQIVENTWKSLTE